MTDEPYESNKIPNHWGSASKRSVDGKMIAISGLRLLKRGTTLMFPRSRSFPKYSIVEIAFTDETSIKPGGIVNSVLYLGFFEVLTGGIIVIDESVTIGEKIIGKVLGFSDIHEPNHLNILVSNDISQYRSVMENASDGSILELDIKLDDTILFG